MEYEILFEMVDDLPFLILLYKWKEVSRHVCLSLKQAQFVESYYYLMEQQKELSENPFGTKDELEEAVLYLTEKYNATTPQSLTWSSWESEGT